MDFTHFDAQGNARMVDVSEKEVTSRTAVAEGRILVSREVFEAVEKKTVKKNYIEDIPRDVFDRAQRELARRRTARPKKAGNDSSFANRLVCADCGAFYGHKVWKSRGKSAIRYDVWYCNHRYTGEVKCETPTLKEDEIKAAFVKVLKKQKRAETEYSDVLWRKLVETVTIQKDRKATFLLADGSEVTVRI